MSHLSKVFNKVPVKIQKRSGFDLSHENFFTASTGTLTPCYVEEVLPGDKFSIGTAMQVKMPPFAVDFYGRIDAKLEFFFVPNRLVWGGWQQFITASSNGGPDGGNTTSYTVPFVNSSSARANPGTLYDYLGCKKAQGSTGYSAGLNALPFLAYQKIWDDWYRDSLLQKPFFTEGVPGSVASAPTVKDMPYILSSKNVRGTDVGYDGVALESLRQRNWSKDYFTSCTTRPQNGAAASLSFEVADATGSFSIASLRAANALQKWLERNGIAGNRYYDQILAHFGVVPSDASVQRSLFLGSLTSPVIVNSVNQTATSSVSNSTNPFSTVGSSYGKAQCFEKGSLVKGFEAKEHGYIIGIFSLVPHANYSSGIRRHLIGRQYNSDFAWPEFSGIGDQKVYVAEINSSSSMGQNTFGYNQRYSEYKYHDDEVHGYLRDGTMVSGADFAIDLTPYALQRSITGTDAITISSAFIQIPTNFLDNQLAATEKLSEYSCMVDCYFDVKSLRTLPEYSLPCL